MLCKLQFLQVLLPQWIQMLLHNSAQTHCSPNLLKWVLLYGIMIGCMLTHEMEVPIIRKYGATNQQLYPRNFCHFREEETATEKTGLARIHNIDSVSPKPAKYHFPTPPLNRLLTALALHVTLSPRAICVPSATPTVWLRCECAGARVLRFRDCEMCAAFDSQVAANGSDEPRHFFCHAVN